MTVAHTSGDHRRVCFGGRDIEVTVPQADARDVCELEVLRLKLARIEAVNALLQRAWDSDALLPIQCGEVYAPHEHEKEINRPESQEYSNDDHRHGADQRAAHEDKVVKEMACKRLCELFRDKSPALCIETLRLECRRQRGIDMAVRAEAAADVDLYVSHRSDGFANEERAVRRVPFHTNLRCFFFVFSTVFSAVFPSARTKKWTVGAKLGTLLIQTFT